MSLSAKHLVLLTRTTTADILQQSRYLSTTQCRPRRVFWTTRPIPRGTERRILNAVTAPVYAPDPRSPAEKCNDDWKQKEESRRSEVKSEQNYFYLGQINLFS